MAQEKRRGLLAASMDIPADYEDEFNRWYNTEHLQERVGIPGFFNGRRYISLEGKPKYFALYETEEPGVLTGNAYKKILENPTPWTQKTMGLFQNFVRNIYEEIFSYGSPSREGTPYVLTGRLDITPDKEREFNDWYNEDHIPALCKVPGVRSAKRYQVVQGTPKYLAVYQLDNPDVINGEDWAKARDYGRTSLVKPHLQNVQRNVGKLLFQLNK
jgi:hypothetical protein